MKKILGVFTATALAFALLAGCGGGVSSTASGVSNTGKEFDDSFEITVVSREDGSGTRGAFVELTGVEEKDANGNKVDMTTVEAVTVSSTSVVMTTVSGDPYGIGYISMGSLNNTVKAVTINGVEPTAENVKNGNYAIARPFNLAIKEGVSEAAQDFITFIQSSEGQKVVEENGFISVVENPAAYESDKPSGKVVVAGSSSVTPVMEKLKEAYALVNPNVAVEIQMSDSSTGMSAVAQGICDIGMSSRELKDSELQSGLTPIVIAMDGIAVIVNKENPVADISSESLKSIYTGETLTWAEVA